MYFLTSGLEATDWRSRQEHLLGHSCRCKNVFFCMQTGGNSSYFPSFGASAHLAPLFEPLRQLLLGMKAGVFSVMLLPSWVMTRYLFNEVPGGVNSGTSDG